MMYLLQFIFIFIIDRITKTIALTYFQSPYAINPYLTFELTFNRGISWGLFHDATNILFIIVSIIIALVTTFLCWHAYYCYRRNAAIWGHIFIIAGSFSNLIDRIVYDGVIDFILLSYKHYSWPVFNVADMAIVCGIGLLLFFDEI